MKLQFPYQLVNDLKTVTSTANYSCEVERPHTSLVTRYKKDFNNIHEQP